MSTPELTDYEFARLKYSIQRLMLEVIALQKIYQGQTGRHFVISRPLTSLKREMEALENK